MRVTRILHPVGQGAFYTECFYADNKIVNVVFDCGSDKKTAVKKCVNDYYRNYKCSKYYSTISSTNNQLIQKPVIDAVFISHFDKDHINGLEELFSKFSIEKIFLPLIDDNKVYSLSRSFWNSIESSFFRNVLNSAISGTPIENYGETKVIRIDEAKNEDVDNDTIIPLDNDFSNENDRLVKSGTSLSLSNNGKVLWIFRTFNYDNDVCQRSTILQQVLSKDGITLSLKEILQNLFNQNPWNAKKQTYKNIIHRAYNSVGSKLGKNSIINDNSMVTYSGPIDDKIQCHSRIANLKNSLYSFFYFSFCHFFYDLCKKAGCIYFGDYDANTQSKFMQYDKHFKKQIPLLHMLQIPHHGSDVNYNSNLNNPPKFSFISAGLHNKYHHPCASVLQDMNLHMVPWIWIHDFFGCVIVDYDIQ